MRADSDMCKCAVCGLLFKDEWAFEAHRAGKHSISQTRQCVPLEALRGAGLKLIDPKIPGKGWRL